MRQASEKERHHTHTRTHAQQGKEGTSDICASAHASRGRVGEEEETEREIPTGERSRAYFGSRFPLLPVRARDNPRRFGGAIVTEGEARSWSWRSDAGSRGGRIRSAIVLLVVITVAVVLSGKVE